MDEQTLEPWLQRVNQAIVDLDTIPLIKAPPLFDWKMFSGGLQETFSLPDCEIKASKQKWVAKEDLFEQMGENPELMAFNVSPLKGAAFWIMAKEDIHKLSTLLLKTSFSSDLLEEGFYRYVLLHGLDSLSQSEIFSGLSLKMNETLQPQAPAYLCQEILINANNLSCWGRLAFSPSFQKEWNEHFAEAPSIFEKEIAEKLEIPLSIIAGKGSFHPLEWERIKPGDFFVIDRMTYDPKHDRRMVGINVGHTTLFHGKWKHDKIKILDYALYQEEKAMNEETPIEETPLETEEPLEVQPQKTEALTKVPLELTVEIARVKITLDKLMSLQPGNVLHLSLSPNEAVDLVVNNKKIGKGEIVILGETLGVRIVEVG